MRSDSARLLSPSSSNSNGGKSSKPVASEQMSAHSDDASVAAAAAASAAAAAAAAAVARAVAEGGTLPPIATAEAMAAGAALSPPASPRASGDWQRQVAAAAVNEPFAFDTARLSRSPPPSPEMTTGKKKEATATAEDQQPKNKGDVIDAPAKLQREPSFSTGGGDNAHAVAAAAAAAAAVAATAARLSAAEATATDFVRTRRAIQLRLVLEIERKLRLADESAELKADRDAICGEVFSDITGEVDESSAARLGIPWHGPPSNDGSASSSASAASTPTRREALPDLGRHHSNQNALFYEVLAPFLAANPALADALLGVMRRLWGQAYVAPVYALLLHRWLLTHRDAGLRRDRTKHVHVLAIGAQQLFWADVHSDALRFQPLFSWLAGAVALDPRRAALDALPLQCRAGLLAVVAAFLPYYATSPRAFAAALRAMPSPKTLAPPPRGCPHGGGVDLVLTEAADMLGLLKSDSSILVWLDSLRGISESCPDILSSRRGGASRAVRLRLQSSLHGLTARGGPRYLSPTVRSAAFESLDALFPAGAAPRRFVAVLAAAWARAAAVWMSTGAGAALAAASGAGGFWGLVVGGAGSAAGAAADVVLGAPLRAARGARRRFDGMVDYSLRANVVPAIVAVMAMFSEVVGGAKRRLSRALGWGLTTSTSTRS